MCGADWGGGQPFALHRHLRKVIRAAGLTHQLSPNGMAIEGPWDAVMACVRVCHDALHAMGAPRIYTTLKLNTRIDREQSFLDKVASVEQQLQG